MCGVVEEMGIRLVALQLPQAKAMPAVILSILRSCKAAVMLYQEAGGRS